MKVLEAFSGAERRHRGFRYPLKAFRNHSAPAPLRDFHIPLPEAREKRSDFQETALPSLLLLRDPHIWFWTQWEQTSGVRWKIFEINYENFFSSMANISLKFPILYSTKIILN